MRPQFLLQLVLASVAVATALWGYDLDEAASWPDGTVTLVYNLGTSPIYTDGLTPNGVADAARAMWNPYLGRIQLAGQAGSTGVPPEDNNTNNLFFAANVYGTAFGTDVLAVTLISHTTTRRVEADIIVNSAEQWDSYRGGLRSATVDLRRVLVHELGHLLGLDHPDEAGQWVTAIMNSHVNYVEEPARDDQYGAAARYGAGTGSQKPVIQQQPRDESVFEGEFARFYVTLDDATGATYQWEKNGRPIQGATGSELRFSSVTSADAGDYAVVITTPLATLVSETATLTVRPPELPVIQDGPSDRTVQEDEDVSFSVWASGTAPLQFQWLRNGVPIPNATSSYYSISSVTLSDAGDYAVVVTNAAGSVTSPSARLTVVRTPLPAVGRIGNVNATIGRSASFSVHFWGPGTYRYQWYKDGEPIAGATSSSYTIGSVSPADAGEYTVAVTNRTGTTVSRAGLLTVTTSADSAYGRWLQVQRLGDIVYFLFENPARIERFDLAAEGFLPALPLPRAPTGMTLHDSSIYVAFGRSVSRFSLAGVEEQPLFNTESDIRELFVAAGHLYAVIQGYGKIVSYSLATGATGAALDFSYDLQAGFSYASLLGKVFAVSRGISPADISSGTVEADGTFSSIKGSPYHGDYPVGQRTVLFPDQERVTDNSGTVYWTNDLTFAGSVSGFDDIAFRSNGSLVVLRGGQLVAFDARLRETGRARLSAGAHRLFLRGAHAYTFAPPQTSGSTTTWEKVALSAIVPPAPPAARDPRTVVFRPDAADMDRDGNLLLLDRLHRQLYRWSSAKHEFLPSIPLRGGANFFTYNRELHRVYLGYADQMVTEVRLDTDAREYEFTRAPAGLLGLASAGAFPMMIDASGAWCSYYLFTRDGVQTAWREWSYAASDYVWDPVRRRMYQFRDDTSPNDLLYTEVRADGTFGGQVDSPYHGDVRTRYPIRVSPNGDVILLGSGQLFSAHTLQQNNALANEADDAAWLNNRLYTVRYGTAGAEVQRWGGQNYLLDASASFSGYPLRLFTLATGRLLLLSVDGKRLVFRELDADLGLLREDGNLPAASGRFRNLSSRARVSTGSNVTIMGFVLSGSGQGQVTVRAVGPTLESFGVTDVLADPQVDIFRSGGERVASNDDWSTNFETALALEDVFARTGAFGLARSTRDAALIATLGPGSYTAVVSGVGQSRGVGLVELYEIEGTEEVLRLVNLSTRAEVGLGENVLIAGFVVGGPTARQVLVRGVGPALARFNVTNPLQDPLLIVRDSAKQMVGENDNWDGDTGVSAATTAVGAFEFAVGSKDAALLLTLEPGAYTATVKGTGDSTGVALVEVYEVSGTQASQAAMPLPAAQ